MAESDRIIEALQTNSGVLLKDNFIECWGLRNADKPVRIVVTHLVDPTEAGGYRLRSTVTYGIRISHSQDASLDKAPSKISGFPRSVAA
jgi:hypothetical protein